MPTTNHSLIEAITEAIDKASERAMSANHKHRLSYQACLQALNSLLDGDPTLVFLMVDLNDQIEADPATQPTATAATREPLEDLVWHLDVLVERAILTEGLEQPS
ncbi:MAG: hypothetical protein ACR2MB_15030 [Acidimicrobiales bacterium]